MQTDDEVQFSLGFPADQQPLIFKKPVQATQMVVTDGELTGAQLVAWNVMTKYAKEQYEQTQGKATTYRIPRVKLMAEIAYTSSNRKYLKTLLKKMLKLTAEWDVLRMDGKNAWMGCTLLQSVAFDDDYVEYSYNKAIEPMLFKSEIYSRLDISVQRNLKLDASKKLYDWINRYRTNPSHMTNEDTWEFWRTVVHGQVAKDSYLTEYKIFKRDKLTPALNEINTISDLLITLIENRCGTRKVQKLQFKVIEKPKFATDLQTIIENQLPAIKAKLKELGISGYYQKKILTFPDEVVLANIEYVKTRLSNPNNESINNVGAYLVSACTNNYAGSEPAKVVDGEQAADPIKGQMDDILNAIFESRRENAQRMFEELSTTEQRSLIDEYNETHSEEFRVPAAGKRHNRILIPFFKWVAQKTWGDPTPQEIITFTLSKQRQAG